MDQVRLSSPDTCDVQVIDDDEEEKKEPTGNRSKNSPSPNKRSIQRCLEDFGFKEVRPRESCEDYDGLGAGSFANSLDHSDVRMEIEKAIIENDEVSLSAAIDVARELGHEYPYAEELSKAEDCLFEMVQCPVEASPEKR